MLADANLLLFAVDETSPFDGDARDWLTEQLNGARRVGIPWQSLGAFLRISTHPRASQRPLSPEQAWQHVRAWLDCEVAWTPAPGPRYAELVGQLMTAHGVRGNLVPDVQLAAPALEHGICSADTDVARFAEIRWENPPA